MCLSLHIVSIETDTSSVQCLTALCPVAQMGPDKQADGKKRRRVCPTARVSQSDSAVFVLGVAWPAFMPSLVT